MNLSDEAKKARAAYIRNWRKKNPEKVKEYEARHWERKAAEYAEFEKRRGGAI